MQKKHIVATWPKTRPLDSYLEELERAAKLELSINFRVANRPRWDKVTIGASMYMVYDGFVRGYNLIEDALYCPANTVSRVENDAWAGFWPEGNYIRRNPIWFPVEPTPMKGFQGWRWYDESARS